MATSLLVTMTLRRRPMVHGHLDRFVQHDVRAAFANEEAHRQMFVRCLYRRRG